MGGAGRGKRRGRGRGGGRRQLVGRRERNKFQDYAIMYMYSFYFYFCPPIIYHSSYAFREDDGRQACGHQGGADELPCPLQRKKEKFQVNI